MASWLSLDSLDSTIARCDRSGPPPPSPLPSLHQHNTNITQADNTGSTLGRVKPHKPKGFFYQRFMASHFFPKLLLCGAGLYTSPQFMVAGFLSNIS